MATDPFQNPLDQGRALPTPSQNAAQADPAQQTPAQRAVARVRQRQEADEQRRLAETPDDIARRRRIAQELNMRPSELVDLDNAERMLAARRQIEMRRQYPGIAAVFDGKPEIADVAMGDEESIGLIAGLWDLGKMPGRVVETGGIGVSKMALSQAMLADEVGVLSAISPALAPVIRTVGNPLRDILEEERQASRARYSSRNPIVEGILAGGESVPLTIGAVLFRNPVAAASAIGTMVGAEAVFDGRDQGLSRNKSYLYGVLQGLPEAAFEIAPMGELLKIGGRGVVSGVARYLAKEVPGEIATTISQSFVDWAMLPENKDRTLTDWANGLPEEIGQTVLGVIGGGTVTAGIYKGLSSAVNYAERRRLERLRAAHGQFEGDFLAQLGEAAANSNTRLEDPEAFAEVMRSLAERSGVSTVLVSGQALRDYFQSDGYNAFNDPLVEYQERADEAAAAGNDVAISVEEVFTKLPGTPAWAALRDDMRITPGGMTKREADAFEEALSEVEEAKLAELVERSGTEASSREALVQKVQDKLEQDGGLAPFEAKRQAELLVARISTRAARMGRDEDAINQAVEGLRIRQVMPPELARAVAANEQDMVVAILRGNSKGATSRAKAAAGELQAILEKAGWKPSDLSDDQVRQAIERLQQQEEERGREYRAGRGSGGSEGGKYAPLDGATKARGWHGPVKELVDAAEEYARRAGIDLKRQAYFVTKELFDEEFARRIADAYEAMEHAPNDPAVRASYEAMIAETRAQYDVLIEMGFTFTFFDNETDPYEGNPFNAMRDLRDNKTMAVYSTIAGHGSGYSEVAVEDNPLLADTGLEWPDQNGNMVKVLANDLFRAVHDAFGHGLEGAGFRYDGEENAWQAHARLFTPAALPALTSETRGQNSWLNFGPRGEENRFAVLDDTTFADQKAGLLPEWAWTENVVPDMEEGAGTIGFEVAPDPNNFSLTELWTSLSDEAQARVSAEIAQLALDRLTSATGASFEYREQLGGYEGAINISYAAQVEGDPVAAAKAIGYVLAQDSVIVDSDQEFEGGEKTGAIGIEVADRAEAERIGERLWEINESNPGAVIGFTWSPESGELAILNTGSMDTLELAVLIDQMFEGEVEINVAERYAALIYKEDYGYDNSSQAAQDQGDVRATRAEVEDALAEALDREARTEGLRQEGLTLSEGLFPGYDRGHRRQRFEAWFRNSAVRNPDGTPMVVYHATTSEEFEAFRTEGVGFASALGMSFEVPRHGVFFAEDPEFANEFAGDARGRVKDGARLIPAFLSIQNPVDLTEDGISRMMGDLATVSAWESEGLSLEGLYQSYEHDRWEEFDEGGAEFIAALKRLGYDGAVMRERTDAAQNGKVWVAFDAEQIKSINNRGSFDVTDPRMLFQSALPESMEKPLAVVHNLSVENFREAQRIGGLAAPSLAVIRADLPFDNFGEITLIGGSDLATQGKAFASDVYSPRQPRAEYDLSREVRSKLIESNAQALDDLELSQYTEFDSEELSRQGLEAVEKSTAAKLTFLRSIGEDVRLVYQKLPQVDPARKRLARKARNAWDLMESDEFKALVAAEMSEEPGLNDMRSAAEAAMASVSPRRVDRYATERRIAKRLNATKKRQQQFKQWVASEYGGLIAGRFFRDRNGRRKPYTIEALVREMTRTVRDGEGWNYGLGSLRSNVTPQLRSLKAIKDRRDKIVSDDDMDAIKKELGSEFEALIEKMAPYHHASQTFGWTDIASDFLKDLARGNIREWQTSIFKEPLPSELLDEARRFLSMLAEQPTEYFEVKMQRAVDFSEFEAAVVPAGTPADVVEQLKSYGMKVTTYQRDVRGESRAAAVQKIGQRQFFQSPQMYEQANWFYSALERAVEGVQTERAPAQQWIATLKKAPGVKQEELEWTGVLDWLEAQKGQVEKSQLLDVLSRGGIVVREVIYKGDEPKSFDDVIEEYEQEIYSRIDEYSHEEFDDEFQSIVEVLDDPEDEVDRVTPDLFNPEVGPEYRRPMPKLFEATIDLSYTKIPSQERIERYSTYEDEERLQLMRSIQPRDNEDGGLPYSLGFFSTEDQAQQAIKDIKDALHGWLVEHDDFEENIRSQVYEEFYERYGSEGGDGDSKFRGYSWSIEYGPNDTEVQSYVEILITLPLGEGGNPTNAPSTHWTDDPGVVVHVRGHMRSGYRGETVFLIDEMQSDWHKIAKDNFRKLKSEMVRQFESALRSGEVPSPAPEGAASLRKELEALDYKDKHYAWPKVKRYIEESGYEAGSALIREVEDANEGYAAKPSPEKIDELKKSLAEAEAELEAAYENLEKNLWPLRVAIEPLVNEYERGRDERASRIQKQLNEIDLLDEGREIDRAEAQARRNRLMFEDEQDRALLWRMRGYLKEPSEGEPTNWKPTEVTRDIGRAFPGKDGQRSEVFTNLRSSEAYVQAVEAQRRWEAAMQSLNLRERELEVAEAGGRGIPEAPFKKTWPMVAMKRAIAWAVSQGADQIAWIEGKQVNAAKTGDDHSWLYNAIVPNETNKLIKKYGLKVRPVFVEGMEVMNEEEHIRALNDYELRRAEAAAAIRDAALAHPLIALFPSLSNGYGAVRDVMNELRASSLEERVAKLEGRIEANNAATPPDYIDNKDAWQRSVDTGTEEAQAKKVKLEAAIKKFGGTEGMLAQLEALFNEMAALTEQIPSPSERPMPVTNLGFDINEQLAEAATSGFPLFQRDHRDAGPRGRILFPGDNDQGAVIELFQGRDLSTLIHESSHLWLEELKADAADPNAPEQIKQDWQIVLDWFKANGYEVRNGVIPVGAHEMWARGGERYMREGKAPSIGLKRAFEAFRAWLTNLYESVRGLNSPITPEIRGVFDRLLATDEEIAEARAEQGVEALFNTATEAGMSADEFASYQEQVASARAEAQGKVIEKVMDEINKRETALALERRRELKEQMANRVEELPLFKALSVLREQRINKEALVERFGEDILGKLPVRVPPLYANDGVDPEEIAEIAGYNSAQTMVEALVLAEEEQRQAKDGGDKRPMKARVIDEMTDAAMKARYGQPMTAQEMREEALDAVANERQGEVIASEIRALARKTGKTSTPYRVAREWARSRVRSGKYVEEASGQALERHRRAIAKAGREAEQAMLEGDMEAVYRAKQKQMLSSALLSEAKAAHNEVEVARRQLERIAKARTMKSVDQEYLEQAHALLEAVDLKKRSQAFIDKQGSWEAWANARQAEGYDIVVPEGFEAMIGTTNWTRLPVEQLLGLSDAVKHIIHVGRDKQTLIDNKERRDFEEVIKEAEEAGDKVGRKPPRGSFLDLSWWESLKQRVAAFDAGLIKIEQVVDWLDSGNSNGVFNRMVFRPIAEAQRRERDMLEEYHSKLKEAADKVGNKQLRAWADRVTLDLIDPETGLPAVMERKKLVAMALNWGNEGNRQRLSDGYGWSEQGIQRALDQHLTEEDWQYVRDVWAALESLWPEIAAMERRINGVEPERVEVMDVTTPFGTFRGGYYPAVYDSRLDYKTEGREGVKSDLLDANYVRATTNASATKARSEKVKRPILLDLGVITRHVGEVVHDVTHREAVMNVYKFLSNGRIKRTIDETMGPEIRKQFIPWLNYVANSWAQERAGNEGIGAWMGKLRANTTVVGMGWRFTTILTQISGYSNSFEFVGARWVTPMIAKFQAQMTGSAAKFVTFQGVQMPEMMAFAMERSDELKFRLDTLDRDIRLEMDRINAKAARSGTVDALTATKRFAFHGIGYMDRMVSIPTWMGAYNKALDQGMDEKEAAYYADKAIRLSQGAGAAKDMAAVSRGTGRWGEAFKLLTMFYTYLSAVYSRQRNLGRDVARIKSAGDFGDVLARAWWLIVVPPLMAELLSGRGPEEDEEWWWWTFEKMLSQSLGAIPLVRDLTGPLFDRFRGEPGFDYRLSPMQGAGQSVLNVGADIGRIAQGKDTKRATRNVMELVGYSTGLIPGQVAASTQFLVDVSYGEADPETVGEWYEGLTKGRIKED